MNQNILFRPCTQDDLDVLQGFSRRTYFETFAGQNTPEEMAEIVCSWTVSSEGKGA